MLARPLIACTLVLIGLAGRVRADSPPSAVDNQELEREKTIVWLDKLFKDSMPAATITAVPGAGNVIVLWGRVDRDVDAVKVLKLARRQRGAYRGEIVSALRVGPDYQVQVDVVVAAVARVPQLFEELDRLLPQGPPGCATFDLSTGVPVTLAPGQVIKAADVKALRRLLPDLCVANMAKILTEPHLLVMNGRQAAFVCGGEQPVIYGNRLVTWDKLLRIVPVVKDDRKIVLDVDMERSCGDPARPTEWGLMGVRGMPRPAWERVRASSVLERGQALVVKLPYYALHDSADPESAVKPHVGQTLSETWGTEQVDLVIFLTPTLIESSVECPREP